MQLRNSLFKYHFSSDITNFLNFKSYRLYYSLMFFIAYVTKGRGHVFAGQVKIVSRSSCRTSAIWSYFCPLQEIATITDHRPTYCTLSRPLVKSVYQKNNFLISQPKHMLWVLKRTVSMRRFF